MPTNKLSQLRKIHTKILKCKICLAAATGKLVPGEGAANAKVVFVGEAPGKNEVVTGKPFVGRAGKLLDSLLNTITLRREDIFITSAVKYLPQSYITPKPADIEHGRKHLFEQLGIIKPKVIVLMGNVAATAVLGEKFFIAKDHGKLITRNSINYFLSYHPAAPLYSPKLRELILKDFKKLKKIINAK